MIPVSRKGLHRVKYSIMLRKLWNQARHLILKFFEYIINYFEFWNNATLFYLFFQILEPHKFVGMFGEVI